MHQVRIQFSLSNASATDRFFLLLCPYKVGNIAAVDRSFIQLDVQNFAVHPLCTCTRVAAAKKYAPF
jgi:hypothetical protein